MTDYRETPSARPWTRSLERGDYLTARQAGSIQERRLAEMGLAFSGLEDGSWRVESKFVSSLLWDVQEGLCSARQACDRLDARYPGQGPHTIEDLNEMQSANEFEVSEF